MMSKISQMMLRPTAKIRCISIARYRKLILQKPNTILQIIFFAAKYFCDLFDKSVYLITRKISSPF